MKKTLFFIFFAVLINAQWTVSTAEKNALISIYNQTNGSKWSQSWDLYKDPYFWYGVKITNGFVTELKLNANNLEGSFPAAISSLTHLKKLDISSNRLSGEVPNLSNLNTLSYINLSNNNFTGDIWNGISSLNNLEEIHIGGNSCTISNTDFSAFVNLKVLDVSHLNLTEIPQGLSSLPRFYSLNVSYNSIADLSRLNLLTNLEELNISGCNLIKVPQEINNFLNLKNLNLSNNAIAEFSVLATIKNLEWLSLEGNNLQEIPNELASLKNLVHLHLGRNKISGGTFRLSGLSNLEQLWLNNNVLVGAIPSDVLSLPRLMSLSLRSNELEGAIPDAVPGIFDISNNRFSKEAIKKHLGASVKITEFVYSPQRYGEPKVVKASLNSSVSLSQELSSLDGHNFLWFKSLDKNTGVSSENYVINSVEDSDFDDYTCEAIVIENDAMYTLYFSNYREPIVLEKLDVLSVDEAGGRKLILYPNPTSDYLYIRNQNYKIEQISLYDLGGRLLKTFAGKEERLDIRDLPSSTYVLLIKTTEGGHNFKVIKK